MWQQSAGAEEQAAPLDGASTLLGSPSPHLHPSCIYVNCLAPIQPLI